MYKILSTILILLFIVEVCAQEKPSKAPVSKKRPPKSAIQSMPSLQERLEAHRLAVKRGEEREPSSAYLIDELTVTGIYKSVEGYGAFLRAVNNRTFFAYSGMQFYDGTVSSITPEMVVFQQSVAGKKRQVVKVYDPNSLRQAAAEKEKEEEKKAKKQPKEDKKEEDEE